MLIRVPVSCKTFTFSNSPTSVTNLNLEKHDREGKKGASDLVLPLNNLFFLSSEEENSLWKVISPPTQDQMC